MFYHPSQNVANNKNNPTKEILASSGIYDKQAYAPTPYAVDLPNSFVANTGINVTTTSTTTTLPATSATGSYVADFLNLSNGVFFIGNILNFNNYVHYDTKGPLKIVNPILLSQ